MKYPEMIATVASRASIARDEAEAITRATLTTLGERITGDEADDLAAQLPAELQSVLITTPDEAERFGLDEFVERVSERAGMVPDDAEEAIPAVFHTIEDAISPGEFEDVMSQLPDELRALAL